MIRQNLDRQWNFHAASSSSNSWWITPKTSVVDLPHDYSITLERDPDSPGGASNGFFPGGSVVYEKKLFIPVEWKEKEVVLEFEGVYMNATVRFNNQIVAQHPYGYTSFHCDLTPYLLFDRDNVIRVTVNNTSMPNTRWYSGTGIYRHVWLLTGEKIHIAPWGIFAKTPMVTNESSLVDVAATIENNSTEAEKLVVRTTILDQDGKKVVETDSSVDAAAGSKAETRQELNVLNPNLWSDVNPYLYTLRTELIREGSVIDRTDTRIGIRSISFDPTNGFQLNGKSIKLKGGCVHHDCGVLGSAAYDRAEERKIQLLKDSGFNAVRCAHNPPSPAFLDACDRLGMLVIDEAFDCWREGKNPYDYNTHFEDWWQRDMVSMILRDRNHPSIIIWSTGNEIVERDGRSEGYAYARRLADFVRSLDDTRAITNALCGIGPDPMVSGLAANMIEIPEGYDYWAELSHQFVGPLDVVGYNYLLNRYEKDGEKYPDRIICGTETFPKDAFDYWEAVERLPYVIGDFVWTSLDYIGEAGIGHVWYNGEKSFLGNYPWHTAFCGDIDICGFKRPQSYYRDCVWGISKTPYIAVYKPEHYGRTADISRWGWPDVVSSWTWPGFEGKPIVIDIYCADSEVELLLNGKSLGRKPAGKENKYTAQFELTYEPGALEAVGYENGVPVSRQVLRTAGTPAQLRLTPDRNSLNAVFGDLSYITAELLDAEGNLCHNADNLVYFTASGAGSVLAVGNGNPLSKEMYVGNQRRIYEGRAIVVVRTNGEKGEIVLTASAEGIQPVSTTIKVG
jgi:beta-galactosidase